VNTEEERRTAFVDVEMVAVWQGHERGVVTREEVTSAWRSWSGSCGGASSAAYRR
jgi:hypothetical protein